MCLRINQKYPRLLLMKINAWFVIASWVFIITFLVFLILGLANILKNEFVLVNSIYLFMFFAFGHIILGTCLKCPNCVKRPTVQGIKPVHPSADTKTGINAWSVVILNIVSKGKFKCIHCGRKYHV